MQKFTKTVSLFCEIFNTFAENGVAKYFAIYPKNIFCSVICHQGVHRKAYHL